MGDGAPCTLSKPATYSRSRARVSATYSSRLRSSASARSASALADCTAATLLVPFTGHRNGGGSPDGRVADFEPQQPARTSADRVEQVSGRNTIGASRPLAPCTVITRTSSRPCSMSRLISGTPSRSQPRKP